ncbi:MAG TPA: hypothetical protein VNA88_19260 [Candidatus Kapabacteria bacterium]|nr:hypothetical protein [Candidatus Kapabacteria bacterium]
MRNLAVLFAVCLALVAGPRLSAQTWTKSSWPDHGFAAEFPFAPELDSTAIGEMDGRMMTIIGAGSEIGYFAVMVTPMPEFTEEVLADAEARETILDGAQQQSLADGGGTLKSQRAITLDGRYGREFVSTIPGEKAEVHTRIYLDDLRMIMQIAVVADKSVLPTGTRFLNSFRFL